MSKIYGQIAALFAYQGLYKESWDAARLEYAYADTAQNFQGMAFALRNMARIYHVFGKPDSAALAYRKGYDLAIQNHANHTAYSILSEWEDCITKKSSLIPHTAFYDKFYPIIHSPMPIC